MLSLAGCAGEIEQVPEVDTMRLARREVTFRVPSLGPALLGLRTADDVFLDVGGGSGATPVEAAEALRRLPWEERVDDVRGLRPVAPAPSAEPVDTTREPKADPNAPTP